MKLPQILAQNDVPIPPASRGVADAGASALAIGRGIEKIGDTVTDALLVHERTIQKAEATRRAQETAIEVAQLESGAEMEAAALDTRLKETVTDPDEYQRQWTSEMDAIRTRAFANARNPGTTPALQKSWPAIAQRRFQTMVTTKHAMVVDNLNANLRSNIETWKSLGSFEPLTPEGEATASVHLANIRTGIENARPLLGAKAAEDLWIGERNAFLDARAKRHVETDPIGFRDAAETSPLYRQMDSKTRTGYIAQADRTAKDQLSKAVAARDDAMKTWRESIQLQAAKLLGQRDSVGLRRYLDEYQHSFKDTELKAYQVSLDALVYGGPKGEPAVNEQFQIDVYDPSLSPEQTRARLLRARANGLVGDKFEAWMGHLNSEIRAKKSETEGTRKEGDAIQREYTTRRYQTTISEVERIFATTSDLEKMLGKFNPIAEQAKALLIEEINRGSTYTGRGSREADDIKRERVPYYIGFVESNAKTRTKILGDNFKALSGGHDITTIPFSKLKAMEKTMPPDRFLDLVRLHEESTAIARALDAMKARAMMLAPAGTQTPATPPPSATPKPAPAGANPRRR